VEGRPHAARPHDQAVQQAREPSPLPQDGRVAAELKTYRVTGTVTLNRDEDDGDVHLALEANGAQLIAEAPEPGCTPNSRDRDEMNAARLVAQDVPVGAKVVAVGIGFFDFKHGQTGHANNYIELHPLISLRRLSRLQCVMAKERSSFVTSGVFSSDCA